MENECINIIAVAKFQKYDGYERIIIPLRKFNELSSVKIALHMVGDGEELPYYQKLVKRYGVEHYVYFYGVLIKDELDTVYQKMDMALGTFGQYRRTYHHKVAISSTLKTREYLLKGLPIISGCEEDIFTRSKPPFYLQFPADKSLVDLEAIVSFYRELLQKYSRDELREMMIAFCRTYADMNVTMKPVIDYLQKSIL